MTFTDKTYKDTSEGPQTLFKIYSIITHLDTIFQTLHLPQLDISTDESLSCGKAACPSNCSFHWNLTILNRDIWTTSSKFWLPVVLHNKYPEGVCFGISPHSERETQNSNNISETLWTPNPQRLDNYYTSPGLLKFLKSPNVLIP
jgi:hypothetical protein